jgi:2-polyprenyl-6-methoxyphenol hydroxylase-like FAD-dependent oxidoreductase
MIAANKIIVIGAGIGGLAAALALLRKGLDVEVYEQSSELKEVGAGVQIGANGTRVLHALGLKAALERTQVIPSGKEARLWNTGESWTTLNLGAIAVERYGSPHIVMHRGDLHAALADAVRAMKAGAVKLGHRFVGLAQTGESVEVLFQNGQSAAAALLIGADGIHSKVRETLFGTGLPKFTGCVAWRGLIPMHELPRHLAKSTATSWLGPAGHVLHYPVRSGQLMNFISFVERTDWRVESWTVRGATEELANDFSGWHPDVHTMIRGIETPYKWALWVRDPMASWSRGRVTLLGDACHATLPFLGQGAVMALEDAYVLAECVGKYSDDHTTAFARYEFARMERTGAVVRAAAETRKRAFDKALADPSGAAAYLAQEWHQEPVMARYDKVYAYDATSIAI